jgi:hypothetical protein
MPGNIIMTNEREDEKSSLNNSEPRINRGFELMLRKHNRREEKTSNPKTFQIRFGKMLSLFQREVHFQFDLNLDIRKNNSLE